MNKEAIIEYVESITESKTLIFYKTNLYEEPIKRLEW